ncbi:barstar family protein [Paenibacillus sp. 1P07SE]|uniref:barstar family protein n=1 Tax=Paenibacillus sp. 1P07SE TaxID=3132209 RepID=UPI0039A54113
MRVAVLDGGCIKSKDELHACLAEQMELPGHYGANLDALWDMLTGWVRMPLTVRWLQYDLCRERLGEDCEHVLQLFREAEQELPGFTLIIEGADTRK